MKIDTLRQPIKELSETWPTMTHTQKAGFVAGLALTLSAGLRPIVEQHQGKRSHPSKNEMRANLLLDLRDTFDGKVTRLTNSVTSLGKLLDPLADKFDFFTQEYFHVRRGNLSRNEAAIRLVRDLSVTAMRTYAKNVSDDEIDVSAGLPGKASTTLRSLSLRATGTPLEKRHPKARYFHQRLATGALLGSGAYNLITLYKQTRKYKK